MPHVSSSGGEDLASTDEVKVYTDEGEEEKTTENLAEDKEGLVTETEEGKPPDTSNGEYSGSEKDGNVKPSDHSTDRPIWNPLLSPYPYHSNGASLPPTSLGPPGLPPSLFSYNDRPFGSPPPAHMGISPVHIDPKTGIPRPLYPIPPPGQFPFYPELSWSGPGGYPITSTGLRGPYPPLSSSPLSRFSPPGLLPPHPGLPPGFPHPGLVHPGPKQELPSVNDAHRHHHPLGFHGPDTPPEDHHSKRKPPRVKKPLNAFMLFMKEMRAKVIEECSLKESAAINQILGRRWHGLDRAEQAKYYEMARKEKELHLQLYPGWSARDNYGTHTKKKKRKKPMEFESNSNDSECANPKKCRARFGLDQQNQWCKPCRRKKKCIRFMEEGGVYSDDDDDDDDNQGSVTSATDDCGDSAQGCSSPGPSSIDENRNNTTAYTFMSGGNGSSGGNARSTAGLSYSSPRVKQENPFLSHLQHNRQDGGTQPAVVSSPSSSLFHIGPLPEASRDPLSRPSGGGVSSSLANASPLVTSSMVLAAT